MAEKMQIVAFKWKCCYCVGANHTSLRVQMNHSDAPSFLTSPKCVLHNASVKPLKKKLIEHLLDVWEEPQGALVCRLQNDAPNTTNCAPDNVTFHINDTVLLSAQREGCICQFSLWSTLNSRNWEKANDFRGSTLQWVVIDEGVCHYSRCGSLRIDPSNYPEAKTSSLSHSNSHLLFVPLIWTIKLWIPSELCWFF